MGFSRQEYWSGLPFPPPGDLPDPGIKPVSPALAGKFFFFFFFFLPLSHLGSNLDNNKDTPVLGYSVAGTMKESDGDWSW